MQKLAIILGLSLAGIVLASLPIWRSGKKGKLSLTEFVVAHTIFDPSPVMYIPEEVYTAPLTEDEFEKLVALREAQEVLQEGALIGEPW